MTKISKQLVGLFILILVGVLLLYTLFMTWLYPYSMTSLYKNYTFTPDSVVVDEYVDDLTDFIAVYQNDREKERDVENMGAITHQTEYVLQLFGRDWLVDKDGTKMKQENLGHILSEVKSVRQSLFDLLIEEDFTQEQRDFLADSIKGLLEIEEETTIIKTDRLQTRETIDVRLRNLYVSFVDNFRTFVNFYENAQDA